MTKQEQIEEMAVLGCVRNPQAHTAEECAKCDFKHGMCNAYRHVEALYNAGYRKIDEFAECRNCTAWSGTDCTRHPYTQGCLKDENNIKRQAVKEFAEKLKNKLFEFFQDNEELDGKISVGPLYVDVIGVEAKDGTIISLGLIDRLLKEYEE